VAFQRDKPSAWEPSRLTSGWFALGDSSRLGDYLRR
jgi:hypothetical protein